MAYDQGYYQQPQQRPYAGRGAPRPGPPQGYNQPPPPQQYPPQQYDQYAQDGYGYDDYNNGYAQGGYANGGYQDMNDGRGGYQNGYNPQDQGYPPQQEYYDNQGGMPQGRGRAMQPPNRGMPYGRGGPQRPPTADGPRNGFGANRGYPNAGAPGPGGRGGRPAPLDRAASSDPGQKPMRKPLKTPPISPETSAWDNPFPSFPGAKKKTSVSEEQKIIEKMASMDVNGGAPAGRPRTAGGKGSRPSMDDYGRPVNGGRPSMDDYGRPSVDSQRSQPRGQGPPQGYPDQRRGPPPVNNYGPPRQDSFGQSGFAPPGRSMTMPNDPQSPQHENINHRRPTLSMEDPGPSAPYNGPIGRNMPPRPSTASGMRQQPNRPPPQRTYQNQPPMVEEYPSGNQYGTDNYQTGNMSVPAEDPARLSDFYDSYYDPAAQNPQGQELPHGRTRSDASEMPNFDALPGGPHGVPNPQQVPNGFPKQVKSMKSQPDMRARAQPQAAVFEMASDVPPMPAQYQQGYQEDPYGPQDGYHAPIHNARGSQPEYGGYDEHAGQNAYDLPPRGASRNQGPNSVPFRGLPNGPAPSGGFGGLPNGPAPGAGFGGLPNGPNNGAFPGPRSNSLQHKQASPNGDMLPSHPPPVRAGLTNNSNFNMANSKPPPVRNYNGIGQQSLPLSQPPPQQVQQAQPVAAPQKVATATPVTPEELERLRTQVKANPNGGQETQLLLARKLVEASDVLVAKIPEQKARNKAREKYIFDAHKLLKKLVQAQNTDAMFYLADCYGRGALGLETDNKEAFTLYQSAAKAGNAAAAYRTAVCCELGNEEGGGTRKDPLKAIQWYKRAATLGDTPAMYKMGMIQLKGLLGQPKNPREAVGWLKRAAERADSENPHALHELGLLYESPQSNETSVVRDEAYSFSLFQQAADLGYKFSQFRLGCAFEYGLFGCPIDPRQSIMWYSRAAVQEEHQSELALSGWYLTGSEGVLQQSDTEAYLWARKAAMAGLAKAEYAMGYFTEVGIGAPGNLEDAKRWYWRAAAQNFPKARERLEDLKKGGKQGPKARERISRSKIGKQNEGECAVM
ncbi:hypothetical protein BP6252_04817 [Coleophoma cylindrospora]|uniref:HCP-like protein n=1 Tax=Coleophoma cylindrospora TaxID=1849047 RepID=A0A3D8S1K4_9HELO|nr:hypothetical protein BP6252_04817 [Coleophoma cylindrospora]